MSDPQPAASAAALLYLFADRVIEADTALSKAFEVPCTQARVQATWLAADIFAITFWHLAEQGKLDLAMGKRTLLGMGRPQVTAALRPGVPIPQPKATPLDPELTTLTFEDALTIRLGTLQPTPVRDLIRDWFGSDVPNPQQYVIDRVPPELTGLGLVVGATGGGMFSRPKPVVDCPKRAELEGTAHELLDRWRVFRDNEQGLGRPLRDRCKAAIASRQESDD